MTGRMDDLFFDFWNQLDRDGSADPGALDPSLAATIGQLHDLSMAPVPDSTRERIRRKVSLPTVPIEGEELVNLDAAALPLPQVNGRSSPARIRTIPASKPRDISTRWRWISIAAALLILLAGLSGWFAYDRFGSNTPESPAVIPAIQATPTGDWPMYRGNPARTGSTMGHGIIGQPQIAWTFKADGSAYRSPAVVAGIAYLGSADGNLYALDATTGAEQWRFQGDSAMESTPTVADGTVYITSDNGTFYAIDAETGELRWQFEQAIIQNYSAIAFDTTIVVGNDNAEVIGLDTATGEQRWTVTLGGPILRTPGADGGTFYAGSGDGKLYALNATDGSTLWTFDTGDPDVGIPSIVNGIVYLTHHAGKIVSVLDAATGEEQSSFDAPSPDIGMAPPTIADDGFYVASGDMHYYKLDRTDGSVVWSFPLDAPSYSCPVVADGVMYASGNDGLLHALDAETGEELWNVPLDGAVGAGPSLAGGMLYVSTEAGTLYAIAGMGDATPEATPLPVAAASPVAGDAGVEFLWAADLGDEEWQPTGAAMMPDGNLAVVSWMNPEVFVLSPDGELIERWGEAGSQPGQLAIPGQIADRRRWECLHQRSRTSDHPEVRSRPHLPYLLGWIGDRRRAVRGNLRHRHRCGWQRLRQRCGAGHRAEVRPGGKLPADHRIARRAARSVRQSVVPHRRSRWQSGGRGIRQQSHLHLHPGGRLPFRLRFSRWRTG